MLAIENDPIFRPGQTTDLENLRSIRSPFAIGHKGSDQTARCLPCFVFPKLDFILSSSIIKPSQTNDSRPAHNRLTAPRPHPKAEP